MLSILHGYDPVMARKVRENRLRYVSRHGYRYCEVRENLAPAGRPAPWGKPVAINRLLADGQGAQWLVWMDADALVVDMQRPLQSVVQAHGGGKDIIFSQQRPGDESINRCPQWEWARAATRRNPLQPAATADR